MLLDHFKDMLYEGQSLGATWIMHSDGLTIEATCEDGPASTGIVFDVTAANPGATATIVIGKPLGSIQRFHMVGSRCREPLPADWAGVTQVSLVNSAPWDAWLTMRTGTCCHSHIRSHRTRLRCVTASTRNTCCSS